MYSKILYHRSKEIIFPFLLCIELWNVYIKIRIGFLFLKWVKMFIEVNIKMTDRNKNRQIDDINGKK